MSSRATKKPDLIVIDRCAILWVVNWPTNGVVAYFIENVCHFIFGQLKTCSAAVVFDRRADRGKFSSRTHLVTGFPPLPPKFKTLASAYSKTQLTKLICDELERKAITSCYSTSLFITGPSATPMKVVNGIAIPRQDMQTSHEEEDLVMVQQAYKSVLNKRSNVVSIISDDTDVLVLLCYFGWKLALNCQVYMSGTSEGRNIYDIKETVKSNKTIIPFIVSAHALSGCDTVAPYHGVGKMTVVKKLKEGKELTAIGHLKADMKDVIEEATNFISNCYGYPSSTMTRV